LIPVIAIDGPTASGKGTVARRVADSLGFHCLDSGALYRLSALAAIEGGVALDDEAALARLAQTLEVRFAGDEVLLKGVVVTLRLRDEAVGNGASRIAVYPKLRAALLGRQRDFRQEPGLVADGRDMGTVVFPDAALKIYLAASVEARAGRRTKQLMDNGIFANMSSLLQDLRERDLRDTTRAAAPLVKAEDAVTIDSSDLSIAEVVDRVLTLAAQRGLVAAN
jgi:cytidylate kinase